MHVARRIDTFRGLLEAAGRPNAAAKMFNWNDRFRGFVRYANFLHASGVLDVIVATGDLYDYILESDDPPAEGGNAAFLRRLILGMQPGPHFPDVEELRVPIFMVPGNHDYRRNPYKLIFDVNVVVPALLSKDIARVRNYAGYHLVKGSRQVWLRVRRGRAEARCRSFDWSVSSARPPNRTCVSPRIRLSTCSGQWVMRLSGRCWSMVSGCCSPGSGSG